MAVAEGGGSTLADPVIDEAELFAPLLKLDDTVYTSADGKPIEERVASALSNTPKDATLRSLLDALLPPVPVDDNSAGGAGGTNTEAEAGESPEGDAEEGDGENEAARLSRLHMRVSGEPATREDVIDLQLMLDERLQIRQAREVGLCPVREELYSQTLDELIRQITIECPERGLMLLRVRDEARMTIATLQTLQKASIAFGMRKAVQAEQGLHDLEQSLMAKRERKAALSMQLESLQTELIDREKLSGEKRAMAEKKRQEEKDFMKHQHLHLSQYLKQHAAELQALQASKDGGDAAGGDSKK